MYIINTCETPNNPINHRQGSCANIKWALQREREREAMKKVGSRRTQGKKREG